MKTMKLAMVVGMSAVACGAAFLAGRALATGAPTLTPLTYAGTITDAAGKPYPAAQDVTLRFFDKLDATVAKCTAPLTQAEAGSGRFSVVLPVECVQAVHDAPDLWTEATVGAGKTVLPRTHVGAVPFALEADSAKSASAASGGLKTAVDQIPALQQAVDALKAGPVSGGGGKSKATALAMDFAKDKQLTTAAGQLVVSLSGVAYGYDCWPPRVGLFIDGVEVGDFLGVKVNSKVSYFGAVLAGVAAGDHVIAIKPMLEFGLPYGPTCSCNGPTSTGLCSVVVVEL